jgi:D-alanine-D-alanine ligase
LTSQEKLEEVPPLTGDQAPETILVIYSVVEYLGRGVTEDLLPDLETSETAKSISNGLRVEKYSVSMAPVGNEGDLASVLEKHDPQTTLVFNLCESLGGLSSGESTVPRILEKTGFCYVGANPENLDACLDKNCTKQRLINVGIPTPDYQVFYVGDEEAYIAFPAIVKPVAEDCSLGLGEGSIVKDESELRRRIAYIIDTYKQPALVEVYLDGREFSASLWGNGDPHVLEISEIDFSVSGDRVHHFVDFASKWVDPETFPAIHPAQLSNALRMKINHIALNTYRIMGCRDYARVDMRTKGGDLYVLDVNPNPSLCPESGFAKAAGVAGLSYSQMAKRLVEFAWMRHSKR